jgi:hypothetical protein
VPHPLLHRAQINVLPHRPGRECRAEAELVRRGNQGLAERAGFELGLESQLTRYQSLTHNLPQLQPLGGVF